MFSKRKMDKSVDDFAKGEDVPVQGIDSGWLEAFSDAVIAVIITIMVLEIHAPDGENFSELFDLKSKILAYLLSFAFVGIYWNNHHHLLRATKSISPAVMWSNLFLLFWLSLIPFVTAWIGEVPSAHVPAATYGFVGFMSGIAYLLLVTSIKKANPNSKFGELVGKNLKGKISQVLYLSGIGFAFVSPWISYAFFVIVSIMWFIPDKKFALEV